MLEVWPLVRVTLSVILTAVGVISHCNDAHRLLRDVSTQHFHVSSCELVSPEHSPPHPISPKNVISINSQAKWVDRLVLQQDLRQENSQHFKNRTLRTTKEPIKELPYITAAPIIFAAFDLVQRGIGKVELLSTMVYSQAVWSFNVTANNHKHIGSIQGGPHDAGSLLIPVGPEHETMVATSKKQAL